MPEDREWAPRPEGSAEEQNREPTATTVIEGPDREWAPRAEGGEDEQNREISGIEAPTIQPTSQEFATRADVQEAVEEALNVNQEEEEATTPDVSLTSSETEE